MLPMWVAGIECLALGAFVGIAAAFKLVKPVEACVLIGICLAIVLGIHFTPLGWLEFSLDQRTVRFVSAFKRQFRIMGWPVTLDAPEIVKISPGAEFLICREQPFGALQFSVRTREPDGTEHVVWVPPTAFSRTEAAKLARSLERRIGIRACLRGWDEGSNRGLHRSMRYMIPAALMPYLGFAVRVMTGNTAAIIGIGAALLGCMEVLLWRGNKLCPRRSTDEFGWTLTLVFTLLFVLLCAGVRIRAAHTQRRALHAAT